MNSQPHIKIIPPNPFINSILIVYCYINNKTIHCQSKWTRIQSSIPQNYQNRNSRSQMNIQNGNTYKCTPLDYNHAIQVQAMCQYMGKQYKLTARTELVKPTKQIIERKSQRKWILCKITNSTQSIECQINLQVQKVLQLQFGNRQFNLQLNPSYVVAISNNSFKGIISIHRYEFLQFFNESIINKHPKQQPQLSLCNTFQFIFHSEIDRDVALFKIAENSTFNNTNINNMPSHLNSNSIINHNVMGGLNSISTFNNTISTFEKPPNLQQNNQYQQNTNYNYQFIQQQNSPINSNPMKLQLKSNQNYLQNPFSSSLQQQNKIKTKRSINQLKKHQNGKKQPPYSFKTPDPKNTNSTIQNNAAFNSNIENNTQVQNISSARKNKQKIKITQKLVKKNNTNNLNSNQASVIGTNNEKKNHITVTQNNNNNFQFKIREEQILIINNSNNYTPTNIEKKNNFNDKRSNDNNQEFLNIFDDEQDGTTSQPQTQKMQLSSPDFFIENSNKNRPATHYKENQHKQNKQVKQDRKDLPSINLRGSFQQLQNYVPPQITSNKKIKQKLKTQINRDFSYQYPKSRQKTQTQKGQIRKSPPKETFPQQIQQSLVTKQLNELKKQNSDLRKQLQNMYTMAKQNNSLKKKYYQLNEEVSRLEMERKEILADKLKCQANYHKQKIQKEQLRNQLEEMIKLLESANLNNMMNGNTTPNFVNTHSNNNLLILNHQNHKQNQQQSYNNSSNPLSTSYEQNRKKIYNLIPSPTLKKNFLNQVKQKNPTKPISSNHSIGQNMERTFDSNIQSNTQSRKQLRFPAYSYKYNNNGSMNNIK